MLLHLISYLSISSVSSFEAEKTILFSIKGPGSGNPFWASVEKGAKEEAKKLGVKLVLIAPPQEGDVQAQINQVEDQLAKGVDAMALAPGIQMLLVQSLMTLSKVEFQLYLLIHKELIKV